MASEIDGYVDMIVETAHKLDLEAVRLNWQTLYRYMDKTGAPLDDRQGFRLVEALETSGVFDNFTSDQPQQIATLIGAIEQASTARDATLLNEKMTELKPELTRLERPLKTVLCNRLLAALRDARAHDDVLWVCDLLTGIGQDHATLKRYYAQALIEKKQLNAAIAVLEKMVASRAIAPFERDEAIGLLGRANKQLYIDSQLAGSSRPATRDGLRNAIRYYSQGVDPKNLSRTHWPAINLVAMTERAKADGVDVATPFDGHALAKKLIAELTPRAQRSNDPWEFATIAESYVAIGDWQQAAHWYGLYGDHKDVTAFHLNSTIRQLEEVWRVKDGEGPGGQLLTLLKARLLGKSHAHVELNSDQRQRILQCSEPDASLYQKIMASQHPARFSWFKLGVQRAQSVARICSGKSMAIGTGFLVDPNQLSPGLGRRFKDEWLMLTNAHVLSGRGEKGSLSPVHGRVFFDEAESAHARRLEGYGCGEILWESPSSELDAVLVRLNPPIGAAEVAAMPLASAAKVSELHPKSKAKAGMLKQGEDVSRVYVIGHPLGQELCISLEDSEVLDRGRRGVTRIFEYLHYMTPTERGNSGSPVLDDVDWEVVALHHAGGRLAMLSDPTAFHEANEGISITSIIQAIDGVFGGTAFQRFARRGSAKAG